MMMHIYFYESKCHAQPESSDKSSGVFTEKLPDGRSPAASFGSGGISPLIADLPDDPECLY